MKSTYVFDTMGTTIPEQSVKDLNEAFFKYAAQVGYTATEVEELRAMREKNPKDPEFLKRSGPGKVKLLENKLVTVELYPDVRPIFKYISDTYGGIRIFTKGSKELVTAIYEHHGLMNLIGEGQITSSTDFKVADKTNPACYEELNRFMLDRSEHIEYYVSDDVKEVDACAKGIKYLYVFHIDREQTSKETLVEEPHVCKMKIKSLDDAILSSIVRQRSIPDEENW